MPWVVLGSGGGLVRVQAVVYRTHTYDAIIVREINRKRVQKLVQVKKLVRHVLRRYATYHLFCLFAAAERAVSERPVQSRENKRQETRDTGGCRRSLHA